MNRKESKRKPSVECAGLVSSPGPGRVRQRPCRRRMTCPTPREIHTAVASLALGELGPACSLAQLLDKCLDAFDLDGTLCHNEYLVNMTLTVHDWVVPSADLARCLLAFYRETSGERQEQRRLQICHLLRYWMAQQPEAFCLEPQLEQAVEELRQAAVQEGRRGHAQLLDEAPRPTAGGGRGPGARGSPAPGPKRKVSLLFDHLDAAELAEHLAYLDFRAFARISPRDCRCYVLQGSVRGAPALERAVALCNSVSQWVQVMVLSRPTAPQRARVLAQFIHVAQSLRQLQSFNTLMAVVGGLCHSAIARLKDTHALLPPDGAKALAELTELVSSGCNFGPYRRAYGACHGFRLPIVGILLKDLVALHEALPGRLPDGRLPLAKLHGLYQQALELRALQQAVPPFEANKDLVHLLTLSLDLVYTEDELYELSYVREPRCPKTQPPTPLKLPVVGDWLPDVALKPDPSTITKHVQQMVESVFKHFDPEQHGAIAPLDFERIVGSFPLTPRPHSRHGEGPYSRKEITDFFLRVFAAPAPQHHFHTAAFKKPTLCHCCSGLLWGVSKQGYRCQDCGMSCHKQCKELVDVECKRRPSLGAMAAPLLPLSSGSDEDLSPMARDVATQTEPPHYELWARLQTLEQERDQLLAMVERLQDQVARLEAGVGGAPAPPLAQLLEGVDALHLPPSPDPDP